jgi:hypothetical protein
MLTWFLERASAAFVPCIVLTDESADGLGRVLPRRALAWDVLQEGQNP